MSKDFFPYSAEKFPFSTNQLLAPSRQAGVVDKWPAGALPHSWRRRATYPQRWAYTGLEESLSPFNSVLEAGHVCL